MWQAAMLERTVAGSSLLANPVGNQLAMLCTYNHGMAALKHSEPFASANTKQSSEFVGMPAQDMKEHVAKQLAEHRDNAAMSRPGKEWVRGWDDWNSSQGANASRAPERKA